MTRLDAITEEMEKAEKALNENELEVFKRIAVTLEDTEYPEGMFEEKSAEELNEIFGGHDELIVTENVKKALEIAADLDEEYDNLEEIYESLPEE